jgi:hypothetical protein
MPGGKVGMVGRRSRRLVVAGALVLASVASPFAAPSSAAVGNVACLPAMTIQSRANGRFVSTELGYKGSNYGMLRARATVAGPWEQFQICTIDHGLNQGVSYVLKSLANGRFVVDHRAYPGFRAGELTATATSLATVTPANASREQVWMDELDHKVPMNVAIMATGPGNTTLPKSALRWVSAELFDAGGYYGMLRARAGVIGPWETFAVRFGG